MALCRAAKAATMAPARVAATIPFPDGFAMTWTKRLPAFLGVVALLLGALATAPPARAAADLYTVAEVPVDVTAESAAEAREQALAEGHRQAFERLVARLVPSGLGNRVPTPDDSRLANLVRDFEVSDEQTSAVRYLAKLTFRFEPEAVRGFLRDRQVPFAETRSKPVVVLPLFGSKRDAVLWSDPNPWREAWASWEAEPGLVPFVVPLGDLGDIRAIGAEQAIDRRTEPLRAIAERHGADDALITRADLVGDPRAGEARMQMISRRTGAAEGEQTWVQNLRQRPAEDAEAFFRRGVKTVAQAVEDAWKRANLLRFDTEQSLRVSVPIAGLEQWADVRARLAGLPVIRRSALRSLSRQQAELDLTFFGATQQLRRTLAQNDLVLRKGEDGRWLLGPAGSAAGAAEDDGAGSDDTGIDIRPLDDPGAAQDAAPAAEESAEP